MRNSFKISVVESDARDQFRNLGVGGLPIELSVERTGRKDVNWNRVAGHRPSIGLS
jgi:hypothetical protein